MSTPDPIPPIAEQARVLGRRVPVGRTVAQAIAAGFRVPVNVPLTAILAEDKGQRLMAGTFEGRTGYIWKIVSALA